MQRVVAILLTLPLMAAAQVEPSSASAPPVVAPPADTAQPTLAAPAPCPPLPLPPSRGSWYAGLGLGSGSGQARDVSGPLSLRRWVDQDPLTLFAQLEGGVTLTPRLLLGGELSLLRINSDVGALAKAVMISNLDVMATWFPLERGVFLRGGGGFSSFTRPWTGLPSGRYHGANLTVGGGYAFWLGRSFNLVLHVDFSKQWYAANDISLTDSSYTAFWVGTSWY